MINYLTGDVTLNERVLFGRDTGLREFIETKMENLQLSTGNIPYRNYSIKINGYWIIVTFYADKLIYISLAVENNSGGRNKNDLFRDIDIRKGVFPWGSIGVDDGSGRDPIPHVWISYRQSNEKLPGANIHYPSIILYPNGIDGDAKRFVDSNFDNKCSHIGGVNFSTDVNITLPGWLAWETGPLCKRCCKEMTFYARLALPDSIGKNYVDVFFCPDCLDSSSVIKE